MQNDASRAGESRFAATATRGSRAHGPEPRAAGASFVNGAVLTVDGGLSANSGRRRPRERVVLGEGCVESIGSDSAAITRGRGWKPRKRLVVVPRPVGWADGVEAAAVGWAGRVLGFACRLRRWSYEHRRFGVSGQDDPRRTLTVTSGRGRLPGRHRSPTTTSGTAARRLGYVHGHHRRRPFFPTTYQLTSADVSPEHKVVVKASDSSGLGYATSNTLGPRDAATGQCVSSDDHVALSGVVSRLSSSTGTWQYGPTCRVSWRRCDSRRELPPRFWPRTASTYVVDPQPILLRRSRALVTATNLTVSTARGRIQPGQFPHRTRVRSRRYRHLDRQCGHHHWSTPGNWSNNAVPDGERLRMSPD